MANQGVFIVLEGSDGSGKGTQFNLLTERLKAVGYDVATFDFPQYEEGSSHFVKEYLNGNYGPAAEISPYTASLFYALDRYSAAGKIRKDLEDGKIVLANRYVGSNMAHQGSKFGDQVEQRGFFVWEDNLEFEMLKLPRPDINIFLRVPANISYELIEKKNARSYTAAKRDEHEANIEHLRKSVTTYDLLCELFPKDFKAIDCVKDGKLMSIPQISDLIWNKLKPLLPAARPKPPHSAVVTLGSVEEPKRSAAAEGPETLTVPFKSASLLLRQQIEAGYPGSTISKYGGWAAAGYEYFTPQALSNEQKALYKAAMGNLVQMHQKLAAKLGDYSLQAQQPGKAGLREVASLLEPVVPLSAIAPFDVVLNKADVLPLARRLLEADQPEAQWAAKQIYLAAKMIWPQDFKKPLETDAAIHPLGNIIAKLGSELLAPAGDDQTVKLLEATPRQEFDVIAESVYPYSNLPLNEITREVAEWPYQQKYESLRQATAQSSTLANVKYKMDIISDQISMLSLAKAAGLRHLPVQVRTPRFGFDVPLLFEDANLDDLYNACFDESLGLFSRLQTSGPEDHSVYAVLQGHKVRWQFSGSAQNLLMAYQKRPIPYKNVMNRILEIVAEIHPVLWDVLTADPTVHTPAQGTANRVKSSRQRRRKTGRNTRPDKP